jgi:prepilin peptidase CpaA
MLTHLLSAALKELRTMTFVGLGLLGGLLTVAVWHDLRTYRIPNAIVFCGTAVALVLHSALPPGSGFLGAAPGGIGFASALGGLIVGLAVFMPLYLIRAAGAGDVKLMGMVGAFLGPVHAFGAAVASGIAGVVLAIVFALKARAVRRMFRNLRLIFYSVFARLSAAEGPSFDAQRDTAVKVPYSVAIAAGAAIWVLVAESL